MQLYEQIEKEFDEKIEALKKEAGEIPENTCPDVPNSKDI